MQDKEPCIAQGSVSVGFHKICAMCRAEVLNEEGLVLYEVAFV